MPGVCGQSIDSSHQSLDAQPQLLGDFMLGLVTAALWIPAGKPRHNTAHTLEGLEKTVNCVPNVLGASLAEGTLRESSVFRRQDRLWGTWPGLSLGLSAWSRIRPRESYSTQSREVTVSSAQTQSQTWGLGLPAE